MDNDREPLQTQEQVRPNEFSRRMSRQLGNARLVSVDSFGHRIVGDSACVDLIAAKYLIDLRVPWPGQVCLPDLQPF